MARNISSRLHLRGTLVAGSPLHVGGHGEDVDTDLPLARDGAGQLYVPGTSLAGALRELGERLLGESVMEELWGYQREDRGHASFVVVDDALIENSDAVAVEIRDHVGIDREYGSAAEHIKYDRAILPRGTRLQLRLTVEVEDPQKRNQALAMLAQLKRALETGEIRLGAAKTRGLGQIRLENAHLTEQVFGTREGILAALRQADGLAISQNDLEAALRAQPAGKRPRLKITIHWRPLGPLMVKAGFDGIASDMLPLTSGCDGQVSLVLPGSSLKGALRAHAERIVRTVRGDLHPPWLGSEGKKKFLQAVEVPLVSELFGRRGVKVEKNDARPWLPGLGALGVLDCFGCQRISRDQWQAIQAATDDQALRCALNNAGLEAWSQAYHVAIDRWLGSAAESLLYTVLEPHRTEWDPITLEVNLHRLPQDLWLAAIALLLLVLRDLAMGRLPLGFATHRGMGTIEVTGLKMESHDLEGDLAHLSQLQDGVFRKLPDALKTAWQRWIASKQEVPA